MKKRKAAVAAVCLCLLFGTAGGEAYAEVVGSGENPIEITFKGTYEYKEENEGSGKTEKEKEETQGKKSTADRKQETEAKASLPQTGESRTGGAGGVLAAAVLVYMKYGKIIRRKQI